MRSAQTRPHWDGPGSPGSGDGEPAGRGGPMQEAVSTDSIPCSPQEQQAQLARARKDFKPLRRAISVARFGGWTTGFFAFVSAVFLVFGVDARAIMVTVGLAIVSYNEFRGARLLSRLDRQAPNLLAWNQVGFAAVLVVYCAWSLWYHLTTTSQSSQLLESMGGADWGWVSELERTLYLAMYGSIAALSIIFQGGTALFYRRRNTMIDSYVRKTPGWVLTMLHND